jgi:single-stranded DNA-binding protein
MAGAVNKVTVIGRLGRDPETRRSFRRQRALAASTMAPRV